MERHDLLDLMSQLKLSGKLRKIEALFARAGTEGERLAAKAASERVRARLGAFLKSDKPIEMKFSLTDAWSRQLFFALSRRYGLKPYRYPRQRRTTVMLSVPEKFINETLWPEFKELNQVLVDYLYQVTERIIREEVFSQTAEAQEVDEPLRLPG